MKIKHGKKIIDNLSVAFFANLISLMSSTLLTLVLPKFIGVTEYSYYQLYVFYVGYVGFLGFGWIEGVYLKYGGQYYSSIDKENISSQLRLFSIFEIIICILIISISCLYTPSAARRTVFLFFALCSVIYLPRAFLHNLLQTTGRIKEYATGVIIDKAVHILVMVIGIINRMDFFEWFVISELFGRLCGSIYIFTICRDIVFCKPSSFKYVKNEINSSITAGFTLMISNVASMLIIGVVRQGIEIYWNVETFGKLSLTLSISNLLMTFINSVAMVVFPMVKRSSQYQMKVIYGNIKTMMMVLLFFMLCFYYPSRELLSIWLPQYSESLKYMAILFPLCIYEGKTSVIVNTYMKALRKEKILLYLNLFSVFISLCFTFVGGALIHSLDMVIVSLVVVLGLRCTLGEVMLSRYMELNIWKDIVIETIMTLAFILFSWFIGEICGAMLYIVVYIAYLIIKFRDIKNTIDYIKSII